MGAELQLCPLDNCFRLGKMRSAMSHHAFVVSAMVASMGFAGCATDEASREHCGDGASCNTSPPSSIAERDPGSFGVRLAQLEAFQPDEARAGEQCDEMSASNGSVQLDASRSLLSTVLQQSMPVRANELHLVVNFGSSLASFTCTDLESEVHPAIIDETWPASAAGGIFTVTAGSHCSVATLALRDVVARSPGGQEVDLGDIVIRNDAWQWWPPFECHLDSGPA